jgi:hypothetical protein
LRPRSSGEGRGERPKRCERDLAGGEAQGAAGDGLFENPGTCDAVGWEGSGSMGICSDVKNLDVDGCGWMWMDVDG